MSLNLDARQRAMLQEMGITVFAPPAPAAPPALGGAQSPVPLAPPGPPPQPTQAAVTPARSAAPPPAPGALRPAHTSPPAATHAGLQWHTPVALYPQADAAATPPELGSGWLILLESPTPQAPLSGDMGRLLDNMLRAMRLHLHPRCLAAALQRAAPGSSQEQGEAPMGLEQLLAAQRPAMVLLLGLNAARAVLGGTAPLAQLRAQVHHLPEGTPAVVSHDPAHLLRAAHAKPAAWADLCQALALVRAQTRA